MIYVDFLSTENGLLTGCRIAGHAEYDEIGSDIVCAAVSSAAYMTINTITDVMGVSLLSLRIDDEGELFFRLELKDEFRCREIITGFKIHLTNLEEQYPDNIQVNYLEV
ncbi:MAG: ribosomal-processing cysteine protease Prp [Clostridia bacterium]